MNNLTHDAITYARQYGYNLTATINEITLRECLPPDYQDNARHLTNRKRTLKRNLDKCGFGSDRIQELLNGLTQIQ